MTERKSIGLGVDWFLLSGEIERIIFFTLYHEAPYRELVKRGDSYFKSGSFRMIVSTHTSPEPDSGVTR